MHLETDPKTHGHFEQTRVGKTTVNSRLFVPNVLDYEQNPNQIMNDIIKLRHSSNGDTYKFHRISPSVVEEVGDYILNVDMFQFVWWNITAKFPALCPCLKI